jgi:hypothetical protein
MSITNPTVTAPLNKSKEDKRHESVVKLICGLFIRMTRIISIDHDLKNTHLTQWRLIKNWNEGIGLERQIGVVFVVRCWQLFDERQKKEASWNERIAI